MIQDCTTCASMVFTSPSRYIQGADVLADASDAIVRLGRHAALIADDRVWDMAPEPSRCDLGHRQRNPQVQDDIYRGKRRVEATLKPLNVNNACRDDRPIFILLKQVASTSKQAVPTATKPLMDGAHSTRRGAREEEAEPCN